MKKTVAGLCAMVALFAVTAAFAADALQFVIMSSADPKKEGPKYEALGAYLKAAVPTLGDIQLRIAKNYPEAAQLFERGDVEGMFSGSFVAAVFIKKGTARAVARPLGANGVSTYRASIAAKEGTKPFSGIADLKGKKVAYSLLASSGEIYVRSLLGPGVKPETVYTPVPAASHQAALNAVLGGAADYAVFKNTVWNAEQYKGLVVVGGDTGENPDNTLIMPNAAYAKYGAAIAKALLALEADKGEKAEAVKKAFGCKSFIATGEKDFSHTFTLVDEIGIDAKKFDFVF
jgi:ABC-type phosphate/phosphonate transport system substrate-binding protein